MLGRVEMGKHGAGGKQRGHKGKGKAFHGQFSGHLETDGDGRGAERRAGGFMRSPSATRAGSEAPRRARPAA
ncbi:hypothetical protein GCM10008966_36300 [Rhodovulum strictum]